MSPLAYLLWMNTPSYSVQERGEATHNSIAHGLLLPVSDGDRLLTLKPAPKPPTLPVMATAIA